MALDRFMHHAAGIDWYCERRGHGPVVVLVPSGEGDCGSFDRVAAGLADQFTVLTFDASGFSRSSAPADPAEFTPDRLADQVTALITSLGIERATFYGCSSGGVAVLDLVARYPAVVTNAVVHEVALELTRRRPAVVPAATVQDAVIPAGYEGESAVTILRELMTVPLTDAEIVERCRVLYARWLNDDQAAWEQLGHDYHRRLERNYVTWVYRYARCGRDRDPYRPADLAQRPVTWTIGGFTPAMIFFDNTQLAHEAGIPIHLLMCRHFPQVSIPDVLAEHIRFNTLQVSHPLNGSRRVSRHGLADTP